MRDCALCLLLPAMLVGGCDAAPPPDTDAADPAQASFGGGKSDGGCLDAGSAAAEGVLDLVNDPSVSFELLDDPVFDGGVGLYRQAAAGIVEARPIENLDALDTVPYVGPHACRALAEYACNVEDRCRRPLSVMTWNLRQFPYTDRTEDVVVEVLEQVRPDLVGLQEIADVEAFEHLAQRLPDYEAVLGEPGPYTRVAALVRHSRLDVDGIDQRFVDDGYAFPRPLLAVDATVRDARDATTVTFGVVHLKASGDDASEARRRAAIAELRRWIDGLRAQGRDDVVIVGDYNDELTDPWWDNVFEPLTDPDAHTRFLTEPLERAGAITYVPWSRMLDHVVVTDELAMTVLDTEVLALDQRLELDYLQSVSDHRPVVSHFEFAVGYD